MIINIIQTSSMLLLFFSFLIMYVVSIEHTKKLDIMQDELDDIISTIEQIRGEIHFSTLALHNKISENQNN